ncbi:hypothetical protein HYW60_04145 [Candidatus Kaiserbacteria bacterium]|nr:hypothetical protein [Candidatus Kaiserbacteria bacterium]
MMMSTELLEQLVPWSDDSFLVIDVKSILQHCFDKGTLSPRKVEGMLATLPASEQIRKRNGASAHLY